MGWGIGSGQVTLERPFCAHSLPQGACDERVGADQHDEGQEEQEEDEQHVVAPLVVCEYKGPSISAFVMSCIGLYWMFSF